MLLKATKCFKKNKYVLKNYKTVAGEMAQDFRALMFPVEELGVVPKTHVRRITAPETLVLENGSTLLTFEDMCSRVHRPIFRHTYILIFQIK